MNYKTESKIIITLRHVDHTERLVKFLKDLQKIAGRGGDTDIKIHKDSISSTHEIGHDVNIVSIEHYYKDPCGKCSKNK